MGWWTEYRRAVAVALALAGAAAGASAQQVVVDSYQQEQGLANLTAHCLTQDQRGGLWVCTDNGLFRFNGFRIRAEPLPRKASTWINTVRADTQGRLWVATRNGLFVRRLADASAQWDEVLTRDGKSLLIEQGQHLDVNRSGTAYAMDGDDVLWRLTTSASRTVIAERLALPAYAPWPRTWDTAGGPLRMLDSGALWFGCGEALCEWRDNRLRQWRAEDGVPRRVWANLVQGQDGSLWARSADLLLRLRPGAGRFDTITAPPARRWSGTVALVEDRAGHIVTATDDGISRWDGRRWQHWTPERNGLPETSVRTLLVDAEGSLWFGTSGRGLHHWIGWEQVDHWTPADGLPSPVVWGFARDGHANLWVATSRGVARFDAKAGRFRPVAGATGSRIGTIHADATGGIWWEQSNDGILGFPHGEGGTVLAAAFGNESPAMLAKGGQGALYVLGNRRVFRLQPSTADVRHQVVADNPQGERFWNVISDGSRDWFVSTTAIYRLEQGIWKPLLDEKGQRVDVDSHAAFASGSQLWAVDSQGLSLYALNDGVARLIKQYSKEQLGGAAPMFLRAGSDGRIWFGTDQGVLIHENDRWSRLDRGNGLVWNDVSDRAFLLDADGTAWIGTSAGITQLHPGWRPPPVPRLTIEELQFGTQALREPPREPVPWESRHLRATVATADYSSGRSMRIEYRLGSDLERWREVTGNTLQIDSLEAGAHLLEMRATGPLGAEQAGPVLQIPFELEQPWWLSVPAKLGYVLLLAGLWALSTFIINQRARRRRLALERAIAERTEALSASQQALRELGAYNARALEEERKRVSRELHDEMGQQLAALRMEVSVMALRARSEQPPAQDQLSLLLKRVDSLVASVRSLVSRLRPPALDAGLLAAIEWLAHDFTHSTGAPCTLDMDAAAGSLPADTATMVFRIVQESLTNVRNHADATQVSLSLKRHGQRWDLTIQDDGVGFDVRAPRSGYGLLGMQERARLLGGSLTAESQPGEGCTVRLTLDQQQSVDRPTASTV